MKKLISIILCLLMVVGLCGCRLYRRSYDAFADEAQFTMVERGSNYAICKHEETGVYYIIYSDVWTYNNGISVMLNPDGTAYTGE